MHVPLNGLREPCLDFIDSLWTNRGGFYGHWSDDAIDTEYTYYAPVVARASGRVMIDGRAGRTIANLVARLLERRTPGGWWEGYLSSSALSTATAVSALALATSDDVDAGTPLAGSNQNADGGWGDTVLSRSNISTTILCWCCIFDHRARATQYTPTVARAEEWLRREAGSTRTAAAGRSHPAALRERPHVLRADPHRNGDRRKAR